jgi:hypothetical protein
MINEQKPKRELSELTNDELRTIVGGIQCLLWWETLNASTGSPYTFWNADREHSYDTLDAIAGLLEDHGLKPIDQPTVLGFASVDDFLRHIAVELSSDSQANEENEA